MRLTRRPIQKWPGALTVNREASLFRVAHGDTLDLLEYEVGRLGGSDVVLQEAYSEDDYRMDGELRARAIRKHPGVIIAFDSVHGPLQYATDKYTTWQANVRAIALALTALRAVDRYGVTHHGEQYTGWKAIGSGIEMGPATTMTPEEAAGFIFMMGGVDVEPAQLLTSEFVLNQVYRNAAKRLHPDAGGSPDDFKKLQEAKRACDEGFK